MVKQLIVAVFAFASVLRPAAIDVTGVWNLEMVFGENGARSKGVCTFKQTEGRLSGTCGTDSTPTTGEITGDAITWRFDAEQNGRQHTMLFTGTVESTGTTIRGTCRVVSGPEGTFTATKQ